MIPAYGHRGAGRVRSGTETAERRRSVRAFWLQCDYARGTPAAAYLTKRGLPWLMAHENIRYRFDCPHPNGNILPAMVVLVHDGEGAISAVHRTFLDVSGAKAGVEPSKASFGPIAGGAIRLHAPGPELVVGEGLESTASAGLLLGLPAWSAVAAGNLAHSLVLPRMVRTVVVAADHDASGTGQRAASHAARRWRLEGRVVRIATPDAVGQDFNDVLQARLAMETADA